GRQSDASRADPADHPGHSPLQDEEIQPALTAAHMTEREEGELRGDVKSCRLERDYVYPDHHWVMFTTDTYTREGQLLEKKHVNPDGSKWWVINHYDERGLLTRKERGGDKPVMHHHYSYEY